MHLLRYLLLLPVLAVACQSGDSGQNTQTQTQTEEAAPATQAVLVRDPRSIGPAKADEQMAIEAAQQKILAATENQLIGYWTGAFGKNKITLALAEAYGGKAAGHSVCAGNYRPVTGEMRDLGNGRYAFDLREPGDDRYDGRFSFTIDLGAGSLDGSWTPFQAQGNSAKTFSLKKRAFVYRNDVGDYPEASQRLLAEEDVANLLPEELEQMRNEIYARHGYSFKNKDMRYYFESKDWYMPMGVDIRDQLTDVEAQNIDLIYRYESYYEEYYDDYGR
ncbi:MAG: hypothetical protein OHK0039_19250 [Bacteroidia bacterium]